MTASERPVEGTMDGSAMKDDGLAHGYRPKASAVKPPKPAAKPPTPPSGQGGGSNK